MICVFSLCLVRPWKLKDFLGVTRYLLFFHYYFLVINEIKFNVINPASRAIHLLDSPNNYVSLWSGQIWLLSVLWISLTGSSLCLVHKLLPPGVSLPSPYVVFSSPRLLLLIRWSLHDHFYPLWLCSLNFIHFWASHIM